MRYANITGWGKGLPPAILTNDDLATFLETDDEWITSRTGMKERRISHVGVSELAYVHMNEPETIKIESDTRTADNIDQVVYYPANDEKIPLLLGLLQRENPVRSIIFINTKRVADKIYAFLKGNGISAAILSGDVPQKKREALLRKFQDGEAAVLVATDVAARGLHIPDVSHVFNFDLPQSSEDYVHRIGRTGRAGASGHAISFACEDYAHYLPEIEDYIGHSINNERVTADLIVKPKPAAKIERHTPNSKRHDSKPAPRSNKTSQSSKRPDKTAKPSEKQQKAPVSTTSSSTPAEPKPQATAYQEGLFMRILRYVFS